MAKKNTIIVVKNTYTGKQEIKSLIFELLLRSKNRLTNQ